MEEQVDSLEDARRIIKDLRERYRAQSHQMIAWRRRVKVQDDLVKRLTKERNDQLNTLSSQLLLFESRLCRKQKDIGVLLAQRETIILRQQRAIRQLQTRLNDAGLDSNPEVDSETNLDSLNDSDSAVIMEDCIDGDTLPTYRSVIRSVSDAVEPSNKYSSLKRSNGFLRRPEVLETVYSVEEDGDEENGGGRLVGIYGSFERLNDPPPQERREGEEPVTTYNRVMSNHRNVTKPKDVKYKRINKAKSKSLEELRGRLRNWVDKGNKLAIGLSLDQSFA